MKWIVKRFTIIAQCMPKWTGPNTDMFQTFPTEIYSMSL